MNHQKRIAEDEKFIILKGDSGEKLDNPKEAQIYLDNLIRNRKCYIHKTYKQWEGTISFKDSVVFFVLIFAAASGMAATFSLFSTIGNLLFALTSSGVFVTCMATAFNISSLKRAIKSIDNKIIELQKNVIVWKMIE